MLPIPIMAAGAVELIKLGVEFFDAMNSGATQAELNEKWADMQARLRDANARWEAAGGEN